jgi:hypothetical protein
MELELELADIPAVVIRDGSRYWMLVVGYEERGHMLETLVEL